MRAAIGWALLAACAVGAGCDRREEPSISGQRPSTTSTGAATATAGTSEAGAQGRCLVPTSEQAPAAVSSAPRCPSDPVFGGVQLPMGDLTFEEAPSKPAVRVELALSDNQRERGLMFRTKMEENHGMIFAFDGPARVQNFWMHNTCIPLDMLFITADGFITGILENVPTLNDDSRSIPCPVNYVLEMNAGWCRKHGVKAGQKVRLPQIKTN